MKSVCLFRGANYGLVNEHIEVSKDLRVIRLSVKHLAFVPEMARCFDAYFFQVIPELNGRGKSVVDYSVPRLHRYSNSGLEFELSSFPEEQGAIDAYFRWYRPAAGDCVFDLGAYCGISTYHFSKAVGETGRVIAFEPDPLNYSLLVRNIARHQLMNVIPVNLAIAGHSGKMQFNSEGTLGSGLRDSASRITAGDVISVETITLTDACRRYGVPVFIKMDVEGAEIQILRDSLQFLSSHRINFTLDTNHLVNGKLTNHRVEHLFAEAGYKAESSAECGFMTTWAKVKI